MARSSTRRKTSKRRPAAPAARRGATPARKGRAKASARPTASRAVAPRTPKRGAAKPRGRSRGAVAVRPAVAPRPGQRKCDMCPNTFTPYSKVQRYCSDACRQRAFYRRFKKLHRQRPAEVYGGR